MAAGLPLTPTRVEAVTPPGVRIRGSRARSGCGPGVGLRLLLENHAIVSVDGHIDVPPTAIVLDRVLSAGNEIGDG